MQTDVSIIVSWGTMAKKRKTHSRMFHITVPGSDRGSSEILTLLSACLNQTTGPIVTLSLPELHVFATQCVMMLFICTITVKA